MFFSVFVYRTLIPHTGNDVVYGDYVIAHTTRYVGNSLVPIIAALVFTVKVDVCFHKNQCYTAEMAQARAFFGFNRPHFRPLPFLR